MTWNALFTFLGGEPNHSKEIFLKARTFFVICLKIFSVQDLWKKILQKFHRNTTNFLAFLRNFFRVVQLRKIPMHFVYCATIIVCLDARRVLHFWQCKYSTNDILAFSMRNKVVFILRYSNVSGKLIQLGKVEISYKKVLILIKYYRLVELV